MPVLTVFLIKKFSFWEYFGEGSLYATGLHITEFLKDVIKGSSTFTSVDFRTEPTPGQVGQRDLLCYMLRDQSRSIVSRHSSDALGQGGSTVYSQSAKAMISEIYMDAIEGDAAKARLTANLIIHELMHNKLDAHPSKYVFNDIHTLPNGRVSKGPVKSSSTPSPADITAMRKGINLEIKQYTGGI